MTISVLFFQPTLVIGRTGCSLSVVSQPVQPGGSSAQTVGVCSDQDRVNDAEAEAATDRITAGG